MMTENWVFLERIMNMHIESLIDNVAPIKSC